MTFTPDQTATLKKASSLPRHIVTTMNAFEERLTPEQQADPRFAFRVYMVHRTANRASGADLAVELVPPGSDLSERINVAIKEVEKKKYLPSEVVEIMRKEGFSTLQYGQPHEALEAVEGTRSGEAIRRLCGIRAMVLV